MKSKHRAKRNGLQHSSALRSLMSSFKRRCEVSQPCSQRKKQIPNTQYGLITSRKIAANSFLLLSILFLFIPTKKTLFLFWGIPNSFAFNIICWASNPIEFRSFIIPSTCFKIPPTFSIKSILGFIICVALISSLYSLFLGSFSILCLLALLKLWQGAPPETISISKFSFHFDIEMK